MVTSVTPYQQSLSTATGGNYHHHNLGNIHRRSSVTRAATDDRDTAATSFRSQIPCKFYLSSCCFRGDQCHFSHEVPQQVGQSTATLNNNSTSETESEEKFAAAKMPGITVARGTHVVDHSMPLAWTLGPPVSLSGGAGAPRRNASYASSSDKETNEFRQQQTDSSMHAEMAHAMLPATAETHTVLPGRSSLYGRQMSLQLTPESIRSVNAETSAGMVHSVLGNGSHTSLLDADPNLLASLPTMNKQSESKSGQNSNKPSPSLSQRRMSVSSHADTTNSKAGSGMSYAAAVQAKVQQAAQQQRKTGGVEEHAEMFAGGGQVAAGGAKNISIPSRQPATTTNVVSQSVPLLSSSGSFFDMLSSDQDTFNYTRQHMSSGESNGSLVAGNNNALPASKSGDVGLRSTSFSFNNRDDEAAAAQQHFQQQQQQRRESLGGGSTTPLMGRLHHRHGHGQKNNSEVFTDIAADGSSSNDASSSTWWSLPISADSTTNSTHHLPSTDASSSFFNVDNVNNGGDNNNRAMSSLSNAADLPVSLDYCYNTFAGGATTDDDDTMFSTATTNSFCIMPYNNNDMAVYGGANNIPFNNNNISPTDMMMMSMDAAENRNGGGAAQIIRGEVFYGQHPHHLIPSQFYQPDGPEAALFNAQQHFPALVNNIVVAGDYLADSNEEWQRKRLEGRPEMFPHPASGNTMRRPPVCRAGLAGRCADVECPYRHLLVCEWCNCEAINPDDPSEHVRACAASMEANMKLSFNIMSSQHRECGVCQEEIFENGRRFGILPNCRHIFCLGCIRNWRDRKQQGYDKDALRGCPECRVKSDFVVPSQYYVDDEAEKQHLIEHYQQEMKKIHCKYFNRGAGDCPFGDSCFYLHVDKRGQSITGLRPMFDSHTLLGCAFIEVEQGLTQRQRRQQQRHRQQNSQSSRDATSTTTTTTTALQNERVEEEEGVENGSADDEVNGSAVNNADNNNNNNTSEADAAKT